MARKELTVSSYILKDGKRVLIKSLPEKERIEIATALTDKFMFALGYVPEETKTVESKSQSI